MLFHCDITKNQSSGKERERGRSIDGSLIKAQSSVCLVLDPAVEGHTFRHADAFLTHARFEFKSLES